MTLVITAVTSPFFSQVPVALSQNSSGEGALTSLAQANITASDLSDAYSDHGIDLRIKSTARTLKGVFTLSRSNVRFFEEVARPTAFAMPSLDRNFPDGTILVGTKLIDEIYNMQSTRPEDRELIFDSIIGHEMAHLVQYEKHSQLKDQSMELQADYLAGWSVAHYLSDAAINSQQFQESAKRVLLDFFGRGGFAYNEASYHGSPLQRMGCMLAGILLNETSSDRAYLAGLTYVENLLKPPKPKDDVLVASLKEILGHGSYDISYNVIEFPGKVTTWAPMVSIDNCTISVEQKAHWVNMRGDGPNEDTEIDKWGFALRELDETSIKVVSSVSFDKVVAWPVRVEAEAKDWIVLITQPDLTIVHKRSHHYFFGTLDGGPQIPQESNESYAFIVVQSKEKADATAKILIDAVRACH